MRVRMFACRVVAVLWLMTMPAGIISSLISSPTYVLYAQTKQPTVRGMLLDDMFFGTRIYTKLREKSRLFESVGVGDTAPVCLGLREEERFRVEQFKGKYGQSAEVKDMHVFFELVTAHVWGDLILVVPKGSQDNKVSRVCVANPRRHF